MKKALLLCWLLPAAALAQQTNPELARCSQIFRDNMDILVFPMHCTYIPPEQQIPQEKLHNHLHEVERCEDLMKDQYARRMREELAAYILPNAAEVHALQNQP